MPYFNVVEVEAALEVFAAEFPSLITRFRLPHATWENRQCHAVRMARPTYYGGARRPGVYFLSGVHAREWVCPDILVHFIEMMARAYSNGRGLSFGGKSFSADSIRRVLDNLELFVFPQANPDGRNESMTGESLWRKNMRPAPRNLPKCRGVDVNRNYDFLWDFPRFFHPEADIVNSTDPCDFNVYIGPSALSEPETRNAVSILDQNPNIRYFIDLHSYSELILFGWGDDEDQDNDAAMNFRNPAHDKKRGLKADAAYREYLPSADRGLSRQLGVRMRDAIQAVRGRTYTLQTSFQLYPTAGTSTDYVASRSFVDPKKARVHAFTLECGREFFPPDPEREQIMTEITAALIEFCLAVLELGPVPPPYYGSSVADFSIGLDLI